MGKSTPVSYLLGSQHLGVRLDDFPPELLQLFDSAQIKAFEIDVVDQTLAIRKWMLDPNNDDNFFAILPKAKTAPENAYSPEQRERLKLLGMPLPLSRVIKDDQCSVFQYFRYFALYKNMFSLDGELLLRAKANNHQMLFLEDDAIREQADDHARRYGYLEKCSINDYLSDDSALNALDSDLNDLRNDYLQIKPQNFVDAPDDGDPSVVFRNHVWIEKLKGMMQTNSVFVTVGMYHLNYEQGLINQLKKHGFEITPVSFGKNRDGN